MKLASPHMVFTFALSAAIVNLASAMFKANGFEPSIDIVLIGQVQPVIAITLAAHP
jgi:hypothetical protein